ncbi:hypothetical protein [Amphiplicatus metriothermophilus]|uniref:Uncharacterized protein n=1 Tax=Amphiplicatus metriothermophilus TaxID=1519374 RepID=A0A239PTK2_9PROT|nr:hypothetical protein [Amphiplicatus metriothermophilus]MBB5519183.1 hypothetical protein [Amphiplicatus metriothermophilus]SNT73252.1 hypothetical protein SAMN06297382_1650 [Amphiplicatus metriothermophilus]
MNAKDWEEFKKLYADYAAAREEYVAAQKNLQGAFSELARAYDPKALASNWYVAEQEAHERFNEARAALHHFLKAKLKKD